MVSGRRIRVLVWVRRGRVKKKNGMDHNIEPNQYIHISHSSFDHTQQVQVLNLILYFACDLLFLTSITSTM